MGSPRRSNTRFCKVSCICMAGLANTGLAAISKGSVSGKTDRSVVNTGIDHHIVGGTVRVVAVGAGAAGAGYLVDFHVLHTCGSHNRTIAVACITPSARCSAAVDVEKPLGAAGNTDVLAVIVMADGTRLDNSRFAMARCRSRALVRSSFDADDGECACVAAFTGKSCRLPGCRLFVTCCTGGGCIA